MPKIVPAHVMRPRSVVKPKAGAKRKASVAAPAVPQKVYPPGYFTEPVRAWKSMAFESSLAIDPRTKNLVLRYIGAGVAWRESVVQSGVGWGQGTMVLPGTPKTARPGFMGKAA